MTNQTNKPRVSTDEMEAQIRTKLESEQQLELTRKLVEEHREDLAELKEDMKEMRPWFRAGRWLVGLVVSASIGWFLRGGPAKLQKSVPCVQIIPAKAAPKTPPKYIRLQR